MTHRIVSPAAVGVLLLIVARPVAAINISSELSANELRVSDTLELGVAAQWDGPDELYRFATPRPEDNDYLHLTGQTVGGESKIVDGKAVTEKTWLFRFVCVRPGSTQVFPPAIVYTDAQTGAADSVRGSPMFLAVAPAPPPPFDFRRLIPYLLGAVVCGSLVLLGWRIFQRRRQAAQARRLHKTPEDEARDLLEALGVLKREDRSEQFYTDLEKIILGLWEARVGMRLVGKTPPEVARILAESEIDPEVITTVREVLTECHNIRFGGRGGRVDIAEMQKSYDLVSSWVKPTVGS